MALRSKRVLWLAGVFVGMTVCPLAAEDGEAVREAHRAETRILAESIHVYPTADRTQPPIALPEEPVLRYNDSTRKLHESALWIWGEGRPAAIMAIEYYPNDRNDLRWLYEIASLSAEPISATRGSDLDWTAKTPGLDLKPVPDGPVAAEDAPGRLIQIRQIQRRFAAFEDSVSRGRIELRPMTRPLHRYSDDPHKVIDGAIVAFANGTNPEVLLTLEASAGADGQPRWSFSLAQMTGAAVTVRLDDKDLWQRDAADPPTTRDNYVNGWLKRE